LFFVWKAISADYLRVLFVIRSLEGGGAERQVVALTKGLANQGIEVAIAVFYCGGIFDADLKVSGVELIDLKKRAKGGYFNLLLGLRSTIRSYDPDVVHSYMWDANVLSFLAAKTSSSCKIIFGIRASNLDGKQYGMASRILILMEAVLSRFVDHIICNSHAGHRVVNGRGFPEDRITVIPNGIDIDKFFPDPAKKETQRRLWDIPNSSRVVGLVARMDPMKDHETFVRAAANVSSRYDDVHFVCVGNYEGLDDKIDELRGIYGQNGQKNNFHFFSQSNDIPSVMNAIDVLCLSSAFGEGFPNVIGEAMSCGTTCVVTNVGDSAEIIGDCGQVVPPKSPEKLAEAIMRQLDLIKGNEEILSQKARARIEARYSLSKLNQSTMALLQNILEANERT